jgi:ABC-type branched-subunit amino acid transport system permease subunit
MNTPIDRPFIAPDLLMFAVLVVAALTLPMLTDGYILYVLPEYFSYGLLALSLGLIWGQGGILSFGQAAFFLAGAYTAGLLIQAGGFGASLWLLLPLAAAAGALIAMVSGYFLFTGGVRATYFVLVTLALSILAERLAVNYSSITGGWNGMFIARPDLSLGPLGNLSLQSDVSMYYFVLVTVAAIFLAIRWIAHSRFGKMLIGVRENEDRMLAMGVECAMIKTFAFALSGAVAGLAGALFAMHTGFVSPSVGGVLFSTEVVVWVAIGGRVSLLGAVVGGIVVAGLSNYLSALVPDYWRLILGIIFILVIVFFKRGLAGALDDLRRVVTTKGAVGNE